ncbi:hypothetical protein PGTUg99_030918 [Puccinia graminis f. sp. tritici]|uniref:Abasic site processing protein n=1 Tax=Puccinia graminis f. sp. tritici TaxID=56615 RepID=A0A5B0S7Q4_PUCGR|nr:hypothetical protein PGTUg99_030918 [Puccinia graminis f. sp. tritici]
MCGRFALSLQPQEVSAMLEGMELPVDSWLNADEYRPNYNLAPQNRAAVVRRINPKENRLVVDCMVRAMLPAQMFSRLSPVKIVVLIGIVCRNGDWFLIGRNLPQVNSLPSPKLIILRVSSSDSLLSRMPPTRYFQPVHGSLLNTINARDDKVVEPRGLWNTVKGKKRCIVLCEGFFEWLNKGKDKIPHFTKRTGGELMCLAGLWDSVT